MSVGFLGGFEVMQDAQRVVVCAGGEQAAGVFDQIARPDEVVATQVLVALVESPGNGEAGDDAAEEILRFVGAENGGAGAIQVALARLFVDLLQRVLPVLPVKDVVFPDRLVGGEQGREGLLAGLCPNSAEAQREDELAVAGGQVDLAGQRDVAVFGAIVFPRHLEMLGEILPAVGCAGKSDRTLEPRGGTRQGERAGIALRKEHRPALVVAHPAGIAISHIGQVRCEQRVQAIVAQLSL